jgi:uncharacterized membrane protein
MQCVGQVIGQHAEGHLAGNLRQRLHQEVRRSHARRPIPGLGIAEPVFVPAVTAAIVALLLSREQAAPLPYVGGSLGTLIGADLLNLGNIRGLGAPVASIGGAGTFDGIFLIGIVAVLIASLSQWSGADGGWGR